MLSVCTDILPDLIDEIISFDCKAHPIVRAVFKAIDAAIARGKSSAEPLVSSLSEVLLTYADQCGVIRKNSKGLGLAFRILHRIFPRKSRSKRSVPYAAIMKNISSGSFPRCSVARRINI